MDGPLVPEVAAPVVVDLSDDHDEQPAKKRRVREQLPVNQDGRDYGCTFRVGYDLFAKEYATETRLRGIFPTHYALDAKGSRSTLNCTMRLQKVLWRSLSPDEIRKWNDKVEPDHEAKQTKRNNDKHAEYLAINEKYLRNQRILEDVWNSKKSNWGNWDFGKLIDRDAVLAMFLDSYDKAAALYDAKNAK